MSNESTPEYKQTAPRENPVSTKGILRLETSILYSNKDPQRVWFDNAVLCGRLLQGSHKKDYRVALKLLTSNDISDIEEKFEKLDPVRRLISVKDLAKLHLPPNLTEQILAAQKISGQLLNFINHALVDLADIARSEGDKAFDREEKQQEQEVAIIKQQRAKALAKLTQEDRNVLGLGD